MLKWIVCAHYLVCIGSERFTRKTVYVARLGFTNTPQIANYGRPKVPYRVARCHNIVQQFRLKITAR